MNYKRGKQKEKKFIEYGTPKHIQIDAKKLLHSIPGIQKYPCKKQKGDHTFVFNGSHKFLYFKWENYQCTVCGKKKSMSSKRAD